MIRDGGQNAVVNGGGFIEPAGILMLNGETEGLIELHRTAGSVLIHSCLPLPIDNGKPSGQGGWTARRSRRLYTRFSTAPR